jgi:ABC-type lipoprotein release transport system permease subunit
VRTLLKIAWRSIWRNRRRTLISMSAVGIGLTLVIFYSGMMAGMLGEATEQLDHTGLGHVEITAPGWRVQRKLGASLAAPAQLAAALDLPVGAEVGWRVVGRGLISSARGSEGVELEGVDWAREARLASYVRDLRVGARPAEGDDRGLLIGEKLAERLGAKVGSKLRVIVQRADGEIGVELYRVRGVFHSMSPAISRGRVLVSAAAARELLGVRDVAHQLVVQLDRAADADPLAARWRAHLGPGYEVKSYGELLPQLRRIEELGNLVIWLAALFVYGLVGLGILNTMLMSVLERTREFGVLRAIGTRPGRVVAQVLAESFWIATVSGALGLAAGLALTWYGSRHSLVNIGGASGGEALEYAGTVLRSAVKTRFSPLAALEAASLVYVMALVTALYPAWKVARLSPAEALHR